VVLGLPVVAVLAAVQAVVVTLGFEPEGRVLAVGLLLRPLLLA